MHGDELIGVAEAATELNLTVRQVHRLIDNGTIPLVTKLASATGAKIVRRSDVEALAAERAEATS